MHTKDGQCFQSPPITPESLSTLVASFLLLLGFLFVLVLFSFPHPSLLSSPVSPNSFRRGLKMFAAGGWTSGTIKRGRSDPSFYHEYGNDNEIWELATVMPHASLKPREADSPVRTRSASARSFLGQSVY